MANSATQSEVEAWIVAEDLPAAYGGKFIKRQMRLAWGGAFECDAVSADEQTVVCISTSCCKTATGRSAVGKYHKIKADALYLLQVQAQRRVLVFTDVGMRDRFERERARGRFPPAQEIELRLVRLPARLAAKLAAATVIASAEVSPRGSARPRTRRG